MRWMQWRAWRPPLDRLIPWRVTITLILLVFVLACAAGVLALVAAKGVTRMSARTYVENFSGDAPNRLSVSVTVTGDGDTLASWSVDGMKSKSVSRSWFGMVGSVTVTLDANYRSTWLSVGASKTVAIRFDRDENGRVRVRVSGDSSAMATSTEDGRPMLAWLVCERGEGGQACVLIMRVEPVDGHGWKVEHDGDRPVVCWEAEKEARIRLKVIGVGTEGTVTRVIDITWSHSRWPWRESGSTAEERASLIDLVVPWPFLALPE